MDHLKPERRIKAVLTWESEKHLPLKQTSHLWWPKVKGKEKGHYGDTLEARCSSYSCMERKKKKRKRFPINFGPEGSVRYVLTDHYQLTKAKGQKRPKASRNYYHFFLVP